MIAFQTFKLDNGLTVIVNEDNTTQLCAVNVLYKVGARDEIITKTGFAHLFEHLMFGGSANIPDFDTELQLAGGTNNAYTSNDLTNYYDILPVSNIETALWLESDRMLKLDFSEKSLNVQRNVVCEEFKEHYINKPYGDVWHILRKLVYEKHPYQWPTIGLELQHVQDATLTDVENFFYKYYRPNNAILTISGGISADKALQLAKKWFGDIPSGETFNRNIPDEPEQQAAKFLHVKKDVPVNVIYKAWKMPGRTEPQYYATNLLSDVLGLGESSRLQHALKKETKLFTDIAAYITGSIDTGMFIITGKLAEDVTYEQAEKGIQQELDKIRQAPVSETELTRVKNIVEMDIASNITGVMNKAEMLAIAEMIESADLVNTEINRYLNVDASTMFTIAQQLLTAEKCSTLYYGKD
ncbi:MAG TPA: pitrilysin family protein [Chitinophagales bacterium]|nr:pitrilysin family protein [Chitinophagales bacterium]HRG86819.1 pitrilysin family protein [Chitinophagales bacterium]